MRRFLLFLFEFIGRRLGLLIFLSGLIKRLNDEFGLLVLLLMKLLLLVLLVLLLVILMMNGKLEIVVIL